jgi:hypothetical protein
MRLAFFEIENQRVKLPVGGVERDEFARVG